VRRSLTAIVFATPALDLGCRVADAESIAERIAYAIQKKIALRGLVHHEMDC
jgi:hypothetical protein